MTRTRTRVYRSDRKDPILDVTENADEILERSRLRVEAALRAPPEHVLDPAIGAELERLRSLETRVRALVPAWEQAAEDAAMDYYTGKRVAYDDCADELAAALDPDGA